MNSVSYILLEHIYIYNFHLTLTLAFTNSQGRYYFPHIIDDYQEAQRAGDVYSWLVLVQGLEFEI